MQTKYLLALCLLLIGSAVAQSEGGITTDIATVPAKARAPVDSYRAVQKGDGEVAVWVIDTTQGRVRICGLESPGAGPACGPWSN